MARRDGASRQRLSPARLSRLATQVGGAGLLTWTCVFSALTRETLRIYFISWFAFAFHDRQLKLATPVPPGFCVGDRVHLLATVTQIHQFYLSREASPMA